MEIGNRIYDMRKKNGLSQEALAEKLNVTRQTISKWELGESTPDLEKLIAIHDLFGISMDELILNETQENVESKGESQGSKTDWKETVFTPENKVRTKKAGKIAAIILGCFFAVDVISLVIYLLLFGMPK